MLKHGHSFVSFLILLKREKSHFIIPAPVSYSYIENHLESELAVYEKLGDIRSANRVLHTIRSLTDTLRERDRSQKALELAEIYKIQEQALQIEQQSTSTYRGLIITSDGRKLLR